MYRRLYFNLPTANQARSLVAELEKAGVDSARMHATAKNGIDLNRLPQATADQRGDKLWRLERLFWNGNLAVFGVALVALATALFAGWAPAAITALAVMLITFVAGERFAVKLPHDHMSDLRVPLAHGEVVLMVDVPKHRVSDIESLVSRHHPEASMGGVGWTVAALGV